MLSRLRRPGCIAARRDRLIVDIHHIKERGEGQQVQRKTKDEDSRNVMLSRCQSQPKFTRSNAAHVPVLLIETRPNGIRQGLLAVFSVRI